MRCEWLFLFDSDGGVHVQGLSTYVGVGGGEGALLYCVSIQFLEREVLHG